MEENHNEHLNHLKKELTVFYNKYIRNFVKAFQSYDKEDCLEAYSAAVLQVFNSVKKENGKEMEKIENLESFLFIAGKYKLIDIVKKKKRDTKLVEKLEKEVKNYHHVNIGLEENTISENVRLLRVSLKKLGKKCQEIIGLHYYEGYVIEEIAEIMNYEYNVAKQRLYDCRKRLKEVTMKVHSK